MLLKFKLILLLQHALADLIHILISCWNVKFQIHIYRSNSLKFMHQIWRYSLSATWAVLFKVWMRHIAILDWPNNCWHHHQIIVEGWKSHVLGVQCDPSASLIKSMVTVLIFLFVFFSLGWVWFGLLFIFFKNFILWCFLHNSMLQKVWPCFLFECSSYAHPSSEQPYKLHDFQLHILSSSEIWQPNKEVG